MLSAMINQKKEFNLIAIALCFLFLASGCARFSKQKPGEKPDLSQPRQSFYSLPLERFNSGVMNIVTGPLELVYQFKEEIKRTDPLRGAIPGVVRGLTWFAVREVVGVFEIGTFCLPFKPHLKPFDTDWLHV